MDNWVHASHKFDEALKALPSLQPERIRDVQLKRASLGTADRVKLKILFDLPNGCLNR
ncbi:hypothetical protein KZ483_22315 [Paenibacillus sp. sptzw28]|nr:hypothetical protein KZ483_22315 [Paenibacillus sp. sptzw28]